MNQNTIQPSETTITAAGAAISVPAKLLRFFMRVLHLKPGRYSITLSIYGDCCDWSISEASRIER